MNCIGTHGAVPHDVAVEEAAVGVTDRREGAAVEHRAVDRRVHLVVGPDLAPLAGAGPIWPMAASSAGGRWHSGGAAATAAL